MTLTRVLVVLLLTACSGTSTTRAPVGAGSQPVRTPVVPTATDDKVEEAVEDVAKEDEAPPPGVKAPGNLPVMTQSEVDAMVEAHKACFDACDQQDTDCRQRCDLDHPIPQVEVIPDGPVTAPPE